MSLFPPFQNSMDHPRFDAHIRIMNFLNGQGMVLRDAQHAQHTGWSADAIEMSKMMERGNAVLKENT